MGLVSVKQIVRSQNHQIHTKTILYESGNEDNINPETLKLAKTYNGRAEVGDDSWTVVQPDESVIFVNEKGKLQCSFICIYVDSFR